MKNKVTRNKSKRPPSPPSSGEGWRSRIVGEGYEAPDQLLANPFNWRVHPREQQEALMGVLDEVGWCQRIIVNKRTGHVVDGHLRVTVALQREEKQVPVVYVDLDETEEKKILLTIDPIAAMAVMDEERFRSLAGEIEFASAEARASVEHAADAAGVELDGGEPEPAPEAQIDRAEELQKIWKVKRGDLWRIGNHRLLCGDSTSKADVERVMGGENAALLVTSPPYGVGKDYEAAGIAPWRKTVAGFLSAAKGCASALAININDLKCSDDSKGREVHTYGMLAELCEEVGWPLIATRVWIKQPAWSQGPYWLSSFRAVDDWEYIGFFGNVEHRERTQEDWRYRGTWDFASVAAHKEHGAAFPVELPRRCIVLLTDEGATIYEPFTGSGTTLVACEQLGRKGRGIEIEPKYCAVTLQRLADMGLKPERIK